MCQIKYLFTLHVLVTSRQNIYKECSTVDRYLRIIRYQESRDTGRFPPWCSTTTSCPAQPSKPSPRATPSRQTGRETGGWQFSRTEGKQIHSTGGGQLCRTGSRQVYFTGGRQVNRKEGKKVYKKEGRQVTGRGQTCQRDRGAEIYRTGDRQVRRTRDRQLSRTAGR